jgi:alcohol dehydrogenase (cytochrome c)
VGAGIGWGQYAVDQKRGVVYVGTSQSSPDANATYRPGPDLYSDSIVALNVTSGKMLWYYQTTPHDLWDFDCGWNVALGSALVNGTSQDAVFKACKNGYLYALNAATGKLLWYFDPPGVARENTGNANYVVTGKYDPTQEWANFPSNQTFVQCPGLNGGIEADIAVAYSMVYIAAYNFCTEGQVTAVGTPSSNNFGITNVQYLTQQANTTIYAVDASTGKEVWSYFIPNVPYRGWLTASGGMIFAGSLDGNIYMLDANSGALVSQMYVGTSLYTSPTIGADSSGNMMLFQLIGSTTRNAFGENIPGGLLAFGLLAGSSPFFSIDFYVATIILAVSLSYATIVGVFGPFKRYTR